MSTTDHERTEAFGRVLRHAESDPSAHRVAPIVGRSEVEGIQHCNHVTNTFGQGVCSRIMWLVALPVPAGIHEDESVVRLERGNIAERVPPHQIPSKSVL